MKMRGQDVSNTILEWAKDEMKGGSSRAYDMGKFFFSVSSGTAGLLVGIQKLGTASQFKESFIISLILLAISICVALNMVRPRVWKIKNETDLYNEYVIHIHRALRNMWAWFATWFVGTVFGFYAVLR